MGYTRRLALTEIAKTQNPPPSYPCNIPAGVIGIQLGSIDISLTSTFAAFPGQWVNSTSGYSLRNVADEVNLVRVVGELDA